MDRLTQKKADRSRFLHALYEATDGSTDTTVPSRDIGQGIGLDQEATSGAVEYLAGEQLVEQLTFDDDVGITHRGVLEVERALSEPEKPTHYFPPVVNILNVQSMVNSQIQQGSHNSQQSLTVTTNDLAAVCEFLHEFAGKLGQLGLAPAVVQEARAEISSVEAQLSSPKPKVGIIAEGLRSIRTILEGAAANALASDLLPRLVPLLALLASGHHRA